MRGILGEKAEKGEGRSQIMVPKGLGIRVKEVDNVLLI